MEAAELTLVVRDDNTIRARRQDGAETSGKLILDDLHRNLIRLFVDWLSQEEQDEQKDDQNKNRKMTRRREFEVFGSLLYKTIFDEQVGSFFERTFSEARSAERHLRLQLSFEGRAAHLASIPWEYLYYPATDYRRGFFLSTEPDLVLSRYMPLERARQTLTPTKGPLRVLLVVSAPYDDDLGYVISDGVLEAIEKLAERYPIQIDSLNQPTIDNFLDKIEEIKPHVLHFIGHGQFNKAEGNGEIALLDIDGRSARWVKDRDFAEYFVHMRSIPRLVFLHICEGGAVDLDANYAGLAPQLIRTGIQAVVAMQYPISNDAAIIFSRTFYSTLAKGEPVDIAIQEGRYRITISISKAHDSRVFGIPVLYMRSRDGIIQPPINTAVDDG